MKDLDQIYCTARELPPEERAHYLVKACQGDDALRKRVEQMLAVAVDAEAFIADLPDAGAGVRNRGREPIETRKNGPDVPDEVIGHNIGRYRILERVGEGGFGVVYVAEQIEPMKRRVALKVIKLGMDTKQVVARFEAERQALAMMDHPNIARVLDAGTTETGRPYFVMELVRGIPITDYCDRTNLSTNERLALFIQVCQGIQHAHQKGIIHRDIKPSNILVTLRDNVPVPKVIDFGIAKATEGRLTDATVYTQLQQFIGTPAYISPEQAEMSALDIDTRSDIYSLGVLLYELLVGSTPFDAEELVASGIDAMRRIIREKEPLRPSTKLSRILGAAEAKSRAPETAGDSVAMRQQIQEQVRQIQGDLDWIVMKCLEKDRTRRYETANGLAIDLKRHLTNEPVLACPPSAVYRFQKAFRRNKIAFTAGFAVVVALLLGIVASTWQAVEAVRARHAEVRQRIAAEKAEAQASVLQKKAEAERQRAEEQLARAEWLVYAGKLMLAQSEFEAGNGGLALLHLDECDVNRRGWEHRYLYTRINAKQTFVGHNNEVWCVAFSPDGGRVVTGGVDKTARVWNAETGREIFQLRGHSQMVNGVAFSPDGQRIVTGSWDRTAKVWDATTGRELRTLERQALQIISVAFSPDSKRIVTGAGEWTQGAIPGEVKVWNVETGEEQLAITGHAAGIRSVAFSPDGARIVTGSWASVAKVWDAVSGREVLALKGHTHWANCAVFSRDGRRIVTGSDDRTARLWDATTGRELLTLKEHADRLTSVDFSPDGERIVTGSADRKAKVWDTRTGREVFVISGHASVVSGVAFSADGQHLVTGSQDQTAKIWDADQGQEVSVLKGHGDFIAGIAFSPDSRRIVTASGDATARVWDVSTSRPLLTLPVSADRTYSVAFSPDGTRLVTGSQNQMAKVWDAATGVQLLELPHLDAVSSVAFSPDGKRIAAGVGESWRPWKRPGQVKIWNALTGEEWRTLPHTSQVLSVAFSPKSDQLVSGGGDLAVTIWDFVTGRARRALEGHSGPVRCVAFSPDGSRVVSGGNDRVAKVWDAATGKELLTLKGHTASVLGVTYSPDGQRIVTGSDDRTARIWDAGTGQELLALKGQMDSVLSVTFSPDGQRIVTGLAGANAVAKVYYAPPTPVTAR